MEAQDDHGIVAQKIEGKIQLLEKGCEELTIAAKEKDNPAAEYAKILAVTILKMRNGIEMIFEGQPVKGIPVTVMKKIAEGMCWQEQLKMDEAKTHWDLTVKKLEKRQAQLMGHQSIYRHLEIT